MPSSFRAICRTSETQPITQTLNRLAFRGTPSRRSNRRLRTKVRGAPLSRRPGAPRKPSRSIGHRRLVRPGHGTSLLNVMVGLVFFGHSVASTSECPFSLIEYASDLGFFLRVRPIVRLNYPGQTRLQLPKGSGRERGRFDRSIYVPAYRYLHAPVPRALVQQLHPLLSLGWHLYR